MAGIEIRRNDYTGAGIYRTSESDVRSTLTGIKLQVDSLQEALNLEVLQIPTNISYSLGQELSVPGMSSDTFTLKGTITKDKTNDVSGVYTALDLRYALLNWHTTGLMTLVWTDEADSGVTMSYTGLMLRVSIAYNATNLDQFPFTLTFVWGYGG